MIKFPTKLNTANECKKVGENTIELQLSAIRDVNTRF